MTLLSQVKVKMLAPRLARRHKNGGEDELPWWSHILPKSPTFLLWSCLARSRRDKGRQNYTWMDLSHLEDSFRPEALACSGVKWHNVHYFYIFFCNIPSNKLALSQFQNLSDLSKSSQKVFCHGFTPYSALSSLECATLKETVHLPNMWFYLR